MKLLLTPIEARILGSLMEKEVTTPDQYPLTLNSLVIACNQKSSREPVTQLSESDVMGGLDSLKAKHLILIISSNTGRTNKYKHRFSGSQTSVFQFSPAESALLCVLLLRGAQTPGELRTRTSRLHDFTDVSALEKVLDGLCSRDDGPYARRLEREPGKREARYVHLFYDENDAAEMISVAGDSQAGGVVGNTSVRLAALEEEVADLRTQVKELRELLDSLTS